MSGPRCLFCALMRPHPEGGNWCMRTGVLKASRDCCVYFQPGAGYEAVGYPQNSRIGAPIVPQIPRETKRAIYSVALVFDPARGLVPADNTQAQQGGNS